MLLDKLLDTAHGALDLLLLHLGAAKLDLHLLAPLCAIHETVALGGVSVELEGASALLELTLEVVGCLRVREPRDVVLVAKVALGGFLHRAHVSKALVPAIEGDRGINLVNVDCGSERERPPHAKAGDSHLGAPVCLEPLGARLDILHSAGPVQPRHDVVGLGRLIGELSAVEVRDSHAGVAGGCDVGGCRLDLVVDPPPLLDDDDAAAAIHGGGGIDGHVRAVVALDLDSFHCDSRGFKKR
mmetsp:Transcript_20482/g.39763  ORF Transcript_20482/g.39763 Transcript_20482/m.39763 type:complete len:242 (-) Transcript_20482:8-733(-)